MTSRLHAKSENISKPELDLFTLPGTQTSIERKYYNMYLPVHSLNDNVPIEYHVPGHGNAMIDLLMTMQYFKLQIVYKDGSLMPAPASTASSSASSSVASNSGETSRNESTAKSTNVACVNNMLHSLIQNITIKLNGHTVSNYATNYAYKAIFENTSAMSTAAKKSHMTSQMYYRDTPGFMDECSDKNAGFKARQSFSEGSAIFELYGPLYCDIFNISRYLLNDVSMNLKIVRNEDAFCLMGDSDIFKLKMLESRLYVNFAEIQPSDLIGIHQQLSTTRAVYPYTRTEIKTFKIGTDCASFVKDHVFLGLQPRRVLIGFVPHEHFSGHIKKNPFNFVSCGITSLSIVSGNQQFPNNPLEPDFDNKGASILSYSSLFSGTGIHFGDEGNGISREDYQNGYTLWCFDLTQDHSAASSSHWNENRQGNFRIHITLKEPLKHAVIGIVYAEFDALMTIDMQRNIQLT